MTDYTWPSSVVPTSSALSWVSNDAEFRSPLSGTIRTESRPGGRWEMTITVANLKADSEALHDLEAFLFRLNGKANRAKIPDFAYSRLGTAGGTPVVNGNNQSGLSINTTGWPAETTVLKAGDRFTVYSASQAQMLVAAADFTSSIAGAGAITLAHPLRAVFDNGDDIEADAPYARFILKNNAGFSSEPGVFKTVMLEFIEDIL